MDFRIACTCGKQLEVNTANIGKRGRCPACKAQFIVPSPGGSYADTHASASAFDSALREVQASSIRQPITQNYGTYYQSSSSIDPKVFVKIAAVFGGLAVLGVMFVAAVSIIPKIDFASASSGIEGFREVNGGVVVTLDSRSDQNRMRVQERSIAVAPLAPASVPARGDSSSIYGSAYENASKSDQNNINSEQYSKQMSAYGGSDYKDTPAVPSTPDSLSSYDGGEKQSAPQWQGYQSQYGSDYEAGQLQPATGWQGYQSGYGSGYNGGQSSSSTPWQGYQSGYGGR